MAPQILCLVADNDYRVYSLSDHVTRLGPEFDGMVIWLSGEFPDYRSKDKRLFDLIFLYVFDFSMTIFPSSFAN